MVCCDERDFGFVTARQRAVFARESIDEKGFKEVTTFSHTIDKDSLFEPEDKPRWLALAAWLVRSPKNFSDYPARCNLRMRSNRLSRSDTSIALT
jgi:hypothetical protein